MSSARLIRLSALVAGASLAAACTSVPVQTLPTQELQNEWLASDLPAVASADRQLAWWQGFHDPALDQLIELAEQRNLDVRRVEAQLREARAQQRAAGAERAPQFDAAIGAERFTSLQQRNTELGSAAIVASWELDVFGRLRQQARAAQADLQASAADLEAVRLALYAQIARTYLEYRLNQVQAALTLRNAQTQEETVRITRARFEEGMASRLDLERTLSTLRTTRAQMFPAREQAEGARLMLALLTASTPDDIAAIVAPTAGAPTLPKSDALQVLLGPLQVIEHRPDVQAAAQRLNAAVHRHQATRALRLPQISLGGLLGIADNELGEWLNGGTRTWSVSAGILAPLLDFGRIRAAIDIADARQEQAYLDYEATARGALQEAQTALVRYAEGAQRQQELDLAAQSARTAADLARRQYVAGTLSLLEVLDAERSLYLVELQSSQATADVALRLVTVYQTLGVMPSEPVSGSG